MGSIEKVQSLVEKNGKGKGSLKGVNRNVIALLGYTERKLEEAKWPKQDLELLRSICMTGPYARLIVHLNNCLEEVKK